MIVQPLGSHSEPLAEEPSMQVTHSWSSILCEVQVAVPQFGRELHSTHDVPLAAIKNPALH